MLCNILKLFSTLPGYIENRIYCQSFFYEKFKKKKKKKKKKGKNSTDCIADGEKKIWDKIDFNHVNIKQFVFNLGNYGILVGSDPQYANFFSVSLHNWNKITNKNQDAINQQKYFCFIIRLKKKKKKKKK